MRGKRRLVHGVGPKRRIIPAHAGQTSALTALTRSPTDHPRACGANLARGYVRCPCRGSSPRMRGKLAIGNRNANNARIIPAHAGQTSRRHRFSSSTSDHPRACGANGATMIFDVSTFGSSPRMRGKHDDNIVDLFNSRIIPAHAGQTGRRTYSHGDSSDHPRACGANVMVPFAFTLMIGSSPRMRGKRRGVAQTGQAERIIPAHAGQT